MVKIGVQQPAAGLKAEKATASYGVKAEILLPRDMEEQPLPLLVESRRPLGRILYLSISLTLMLLGLVLTTAYIYRYFSITGSITDLNVTGFEDDEELIEECLVAYADSSSSLQLKLHEEVRVNLEERYEWISVPPPPLGESDPADIIHDFQQRLTAYYDLLLDKCFVIELNTTIVMPPQDLWELLVNVKKEVYLPQTYLIEEETVVMEQVTDMNQLGSVIYHLCQGKETYALKHRSARRHIHRRAAEKCHQIRHFANTFVVSTAICQKL
ncbi:integral membrane protein 2C [Pogona vitticeps]|uniref:Integral membrane protein 2 n=1 Tax=Pogona vitticeps TaxID=103695 RepID=A0A6J0U9N3_9SAUR|nr:integral membrane protein 2C [Pogona vitticeps]